MANVGHAITNYQIGVGVEEHFEKNRYEDKYVVKHFKLHGSVMWWVTDESNYVKIPIMSPEENIDIIQQRIGLTLSFLS